MGTPLRPCLARALVISGSCFVQSALMRMKSFSSNALRSSWFEKRLALLAWHVRHQAAVKSMYMGLLSA